MIAIKSLTVDAVIIGTSPVLLIEGLLRSRFGQKVVFVEANDEIGGAWSLTECLGVRDIEAACHLIVNYQGVYKFLAVICGIPMDYLCSTAFAASTWALVGVQFTAPGPVSRGRTFLSNVQCDPRETPFPACWALEIGVRSLAAKTGA